MSFTEKLKLFWSSKRNKWFVVLGIILCIILYFIFKPKPITETLVTAEVKDLQKTVLATGQVTSSTDLSMSFIASGVIHDIPVSVGQKVKKGTVLARLEQGNEAAAVTSALGQLRVAQANYQKLLEGATDAELTVVKTALENAKADLARTIDQQTTIVENAKRAYLSTGLVAELAPGVISSATAPTISGAYTSDEEGVYNVSVYATGSGNYFSTYGLESASGIASSTAPVPMGSRGLFIQFPATTTSGINWVVSVPNKQASTYVTNYNAYLAAVAAKDTAIASAKAVVASRQADYDLKVSKARTTDMAVAEANILTAEGNYQNAVATLEKRILRAPADGTITKIDAHVGDLAQALKSVMTLQDVDHLYVEANINEANISDVVVGQPVTVFFDATGPEVSYKGSVTSIDISSTLVSGVVNYKVKVALDGTVVVRPGMTASMTILVTQKNGVVAIPARFVREKDGKKYVVVLTNTKKHTTEEREISLGLNADGGFVEVVSGLQAGDQVVGESKTNLK
ncbi:MAG: efflux RND transporter periplasmic adaptor subunit [Minisyncoccia bacterium]